MTLATRTDSFEPALDVLSKRTKIVVSEPDWKKFIEALDEDREPTEAAKKAAERYNASRRLPQEPTLLEEP